MTNLEKQCRKSFPLLLLFLATGIVKFFIGINWVETGWLKNLGIGLSVVAIIQIAACVFFIMVAHRPIHDWEYPPNGNPYRRTCKNCGMHQEVECWAEDANKPFAGWWEIYNEGNGSCEKG